MTYQSPTQDIQFALETLADLEKLATLPGLEDATHRRHRADDRRRREVL